MCVCVPDLSAPHLFLCLLFVDDDNKDNVRYVDIDGVAPVGLALLLSGMIPFDLARVSVIALDSVLRIVLHDD